jgi:S1-C subfamily serine protease
MLLKILILLSISITIYADEFDEILNKARQIKLKPSQSTGIFLTNVPGDSIFAKLGLRSGDKIHKVNGKKVSSLSDAMNEMADVKSVSVIRNNKEETFSCKLKE